MFLGCLIFWTLVSTKILREKPLLSSNVFLPNLSLAQVRLLASEDSVWRNPKSEQTRIWNFFDTRIFWNRIWMSNRYRYFFRYQNISQTDTDIFSNTNFFETDTNTSFENNCFSKPISIPSNKLGKFWNRNVTLCQKRSRGQDCLNHRPNMSRDILSTLSKETRQHTTTTVQIRKSTLISRWPTNKDLTLALLFSKLMTGLKICQISNCLETKMKVSNTLTRHESFMDLD